MIDLRISVVGCGYLGAVHAASLVELGHYVGVVHVDERKVSALTQVGRRSATHASESY